MRLTALGLLSCMALLLASCGSAEVVEGKASQGEVEVTTDKQDASPDRHTMDIGPDVLVVSQDPCRICTWDPVNGEQCTVFDVGTSCVNPSDCCTKKKQCVECEAWENDCTFYGVTCRGMEPVCSDEDPCTDDLCECLEGKAECDFPVSDDGTPCEATPSQCTKNDYCEDGACVAGESLLTTDSACVVKDCVDGEVVTTDLHGKEYTCDDGNPCTEDDYCNIGACVGGTPVVCEKPQCASSTVCVPFEGCESTWLPVGAVCDDANVCTKNDACNADHECAGVAAVDCDDGDPCTADECDPATGECSHTLQPGTLCDDGDSCTENDQCLDDGSCSGSIMDCSGISDTCLQPICNPATGACNLPVEDGTSCADGDACNGAEACAGGICLPGEPVVCPDDGNPCTDDVCSQQTGACGVLVEDGTPCLDEDACNGVETCQGGSCEMASPLQCDDNNTCTADSCQPETGCVHTPVLGSCDDGNLCTDADTCVDGICQGTAVENRCNTGGMPVEYHEDVRVLPPSSIQDPENAFCSGIVLTTSPELIALGIEPDMVVVSPEGGGVLCRVESVIEQGDMTTIVGVEASLQDLVSEGEFHLSLPIGIGDSNPQELPSPQPNAPLQSPFLPAEADGPQSPSDDGPVAISFSFPEQTIYDGPWGEVTLDPGTLTFNPTLDVDADYGLWSGIYFKAVAAGTATVTAGIHASFVAASFSADKKIWSTSYPWTIPGTVFGGTIDVAVKVGVELSAGPEVEMDFGCTASRTVSAGVEYLNGDWHAVALENSGSAAAEPQNFEVGIGASAKIFLNTKLSINLYKVVGPYLSIEPSIEGYH